MKILIACEESQIVCNEFRKLGHEAFSCDVQECSGKHPEWHIKDDILNHLEDGWDLMIAHPPCTFISRAGTTGLVALKQNKKFIGIELNKEYIEIANKRLKPYLEQEKL